MPAPTVTEFNEAKIDLDAVEDCVNTMNLSYTSRLGGVKLSLTGAVSKIVHGAISAYSAAATYTAVDVWVEQGGIVYRPLPSELPIGPEAFDPDKWIVAQGFKLGDRLHPAVSDYAELRLINTTGLADGTPIFVTNDGIAGDGVIRNVTAHGLTDNGGTIIVINSNWYWERIYSGDVMVRWFDLVADGVTNDAVNFNKAANYAATARLWLDLQECNILHSGAYSVTGATKQVMWKNGKFKLGAGAKTSGMFVIDDVDCVAMENIYIDGDRANVSGNNAGFWVVSNTRLAKFHDITMYDLRRYGINCYLNCDTVDIKNITGIDIGISGTALGEAIKIEDSGNITIENFVCTNPSGTGGGQVAKVFHCKNVTLSNFDITDPDPAKVYPGISMVRNESLVYRNIRITGDTQVAIEDNANFNIIYQNIVTSGTDKALIMGTDGASRGDRRSQKTVINGWDDTSTSALAFNITGALDITINNLTTTQTLNISRDDPATNRRTENLEMNNVSCNILNTLLVNGRKTYTRVNVTGLWTNSGPGVTDFIKSTYGTYSNGGLTDVFLARWNYEDGVVNIYGTMTASGGTLVYRAPTSISNAPFHGTVVASCLYAPSLNTQWSQIRWTFYDAGTPAAYKETLHSGSTPRSNVALAVSATNRTLTFTNSEGVDIFIIGVVQLINANDRTVS